MKDKDIFAGRRSRRGLRLCVLAAVLGLTICCRVFTDSSASVQAAGLLLGLPLGWLI